MKSHNRIIRIVSLLVMFITVFMVTTSSVLAGSVTLSGSITTSDIAFTDCAPNYGKILPFTVDTTGTYTLDNPSPAAFFNGPTFFFAAVFSTLPSFISGHPDRLFIINNTPTPPASGTLTAGVTYYLVVGGSAGCGTVYPVNYNFTFSGIGNISLASTGGGTSSSPDVQRYFTDGRINRYDEAAPVVVYPIQVNEAFGLAIYDAYAANSLLLFLSPEEIALTDAVTENTLIAADNAGRVSVYRLSDGTFQINALMSNGKMYVLNFAELVANIFYTSAELE